MTTDFDEAEVESLNPHPQNPRHGDVDKIAESIEANGFYGAIQVQRSTRNIVAGNHRWKAMRKLGRETIPVEWLDVDDEEALRILLADNRTSDLATYDDTKRWEIINELDDFTGTGYDQVDFEELAASAMALQAEMEPRAGAADAISNEDSGRITGGIKEVRLIFSQAEGTEYALLINKLRADRQITASQIVLQSLTQGVLIA